VNPNYGTYEIIAEYFDKADLATFEVVEDFKESVPISLWTDKEAYGLGEEVKITGRVNQVWIGSLDLKIIDTKQSAIVTSSSGSASGFKILATLTVMGDGSFGYTFTLPDDEIRLGDYKISVSKDLGSITKIIHVVANPDEFVVSNEPLTILSDKEIYDLGDKMIISGFIQNIFTNSSYETGSSVTISISREDGTPLEIIGLPKEAKSYEVGGVIVASLPASVLMIFSVKGAVQDHEKRWSSISTLELITVPSDFVNSISAFLAPVGGNNPVRYTVSPGP